MSHVLIILFWSRNRFENNEERRRRMIDFSKVGVGVKRLNSYHLFRRHVNNWKKTSSCTSQLEPTLHQPTNIINSVASQVHIQLNKRSNIFAWCKILSCFVHSCFKSGMYFCYLVFKPVFLCTFALSWTCSIHSCIHSWEPKYAKNPRH